MPGESVSHYRIIEKLGAGAAPKPAPRFSSGHIFNFAWSPKGDLALAHGTVTSDAILMKAAPHP